MSLTKVERLKQKLLSVAQSDVIRTVTYEQIRKEIGFYGPPLWNALDKISRKEHMEGRPLLSAVVVGPADIQGDGFFSLAADLKLLPAGESKEVYSKAEIDRVHQYWRSHSTRPQSYWLELYWPVGEKRIRENPHYMWIDRKKRTRHEKIPAGDIVFFYETEKLPGGVGLRGTKTLFAAAEVLDDRLVVPEEYRNLGNKVWEQLRLTKIIAWVHPDEGISKNELYVILGRKPNATIRSGPFHITDANAAQAILARLRQMDPHSGSLLEGPMSTRVERFRDIAFKSELETRHEMVRTEGVIRKIHNRLVNRFTKLCERQLGVKVKEKRFDILLEYGEGRHLLIEVKSASIGGVGRDQVRQAIGQLFDYRLLYWPNEIGKVDLVVLLPEEPDSSIKVLLSSLDIGLIWMRDKQFRALDQTTALLQRAGLKIDESSQDGH